jgi:hypothetical protein
MTDRKIGDFSLVPPPPDACPVCARRPPHPPSQPHDGNSLFFMYWWRAEHGRWGTWKDAIAHCTPEIREAWEAELKQRGVWTEPVGEQ